LAESIRMVYVLYMKKLKRKTFTSLGLTIILIALVYLILSFFTSTSHWSWKEMLSLSILIGLINMPVQIIISLIMFRDDKIEAFQVKEIELTSTEIAQAVKNYIFLKYSREVHGDIIFQTDEDGQDISCNLTIRKE